MSEYLPEDRLSLWIEDEALRQRVDDNDALRQAALESGDGATPLDVALEPGGGGGARMDLRPDGTLVVYDPFLCDQIQAAHQAGPIAVVAEGVTTEVGNTLCPCHTNDNC